MTFLVKLNLMKNLPSKSTSSEPRIIPIIADPKEVINTALLKSYGLLVDGYIGESPSIAFSRITIRAKILQR